MNDLISRKEAIQAIDDLPNCYNGYSDTYDKAYIIGVLEELPSAQTEQKHGRWLSCATTDLMCSNCLHYWIPKGDQYDYHYCPNCGAKMDMERE